MQVIMEMVSSNQQLVLVDGLLVNTIDNQPCYVQLVHNSDDDTIMLLLINNFDDFTVRQVRMQYVTHALWTMLYDKFG